MRESAERQTEWMQEQIQKHKEKKDGTEKLLTTGMICHLLTNM